MKKKTFRSLSVRLPLLFIASVVVIMGIMIPVVYNRFHSRMIDQYTRMAQGVTQLIANAFEEDVKHCLEAGMNAHLSKPVDMDILKSTLERLIPVS